MKYLLMIYGNDDLWASFSPEVMQQAVADTEAFQAELKASGEWIAAAVPFARIGSVELRPLMHESASNA